MANDNTLPQKSTLKSAFQGVTGGLYAAIGENPNMGIQAAGYIYDRASLAKDQILSSFKTKFA